MVSVSSQKKERQRHNKEEEGKAAPLTREKEKKTPSNGGRRRKPSSTTQKMKGDGSNTHSKDRTRKRPQIYFYLHYFVANWSTLVSNEKKRKTTTPFPRGARRPPSNTGRGEQQHTKERRRERNTTNTGDGESTTTQGRERKTTPPKKRGGENSTTTLERQVTTPRKRRRDATPTPNKEGNGNHHFTLTHRTLLSFWFNMNYPNLVPQFTVHHKKHWNITDKIHEQTKH